MQSRRPNRLLKQNEPLSSGLWVCMKICSFVSRGPPEGSELALTPQQL
jgi:hypothetical protein